MTTPKYTPAELVARAEARRDKRLRSEAQRCAVHGDGAIDMTKDAECDVCARTVSEETPLAGPIFRCSRCGDGYVCTEKDPQTFAWRIPPEITTSKVLDGGWFAHCVAPCGRRSEAAQPTYTTGDRLRDIIDENFSMQPVMSDDEALTFLEHKLYEQRSEVGKPNIETFLAGYDAGKQGVDPALAWQALPENQNPLSTEEIEYGKKVAERMSARCAGDPQEPK